MAYGRMLWYMRAVRDVWCSLGLKLWAWSSNYRQIVFTSSAADGRGKREVTGVERGAPRGLGPIHLGQQRSVEGPHLPVTLFCLGGSVPWHLAGHHAKGVPKREWAATHARYLKGTEVRYYAVTTSLRNV